MIRLLKWLRRKLEGDTRSIGLHRYAPRVRDVHRDQQVFITKCS